MQRLALGIDVGSVSTNLVALDEQGRCQANLYLRTQGNPVQVVQQGLKQLQEELPADAEIVACGTTGSGRHLTAHMVGADCAKNEITAHAVASLSYRPDVRTVLEIGGQDSKIIILRDGVVVDFAMNTVCAAGTGSFLDRQAARLGIDISELGPLALAAEKGTRIAGRCAVFAESDMVHKQQMGHPLPEIVRGLCDALVRNYLNNVAKGKDIQPPIMFQGGVAANVGIRKAFEEALGCEISVPEHYGVMGALGAATLARRAVAQRGTPTTFRGLNLAQADCQARTRDCHGCPNGCEVVEFFINQQSIACWGDRCGKWSNRSSHVADD
ncbi:MAG: acyl-CoA dehydratase activase [Bacillota bacterium]|jgi:predicted CoA-substrate-specific enzyme activase